MAPTEAMLREAREALPELPAARIERYVGAGAGRGRGARRWPPTPRPPPTSSRSRWPRPSGIEPQGRRQLGHRRAGRGPAPGRRGGRRRRVQGRARRPWPPWSPWSRRRRSPTAAARPCWRRSSPRAATRPRSSSARASPRCSDSGELEAIVAAAIEANPEAAEQIRAGNGKAIGAIVGAVMKETKGRADGGEVNRLIAAEPEAAGGEAALALRP